MIDPRGGFRPTPRALRTLVRPPDLGRSLRGFVAALRLNTKKPPPRFLSLVQTLCLMTIIAAATIAVRRILDAMPSQRLAGEARLVSRVAIGRLANYHNCCSMA
jgi:hypothetical protein